MSDDRVNPTRLEIGLETFDYVVGRTRITPALDEALLSMRKGVRVAIKSDSEDFIRRLNQEAAKTIRYGGATEDEALKMITINAAWIIGVEDRTGSIDVGKDGDLVLWDGYPLSSYGLPEKVFIDGELFFDRTKPGYGLTHNIGTPADESTPPTPAAVPTAVPACLCQMPPVYSNRRSLRRRTTPRTP